MFKKGFISIIMALLLASMNLFTVFAVENNEEVGIMPLDSSFVILLYPDEEVYLYEVNRPLLFDKDIEISNFYTNPGTITVTAYTQEGIVDAGPISLAPGEAGTLTINASITGGTIILRISADIEGVYRVAVSEGNQGHNIYSSYLYVGLEKPVAIYQGSYPLLLPKTLTVTNHGLSPGTVMLQVVDSVAGAPISQTYTLGARQSTQITIPANLSGGTFVIAAYAESVEGTYHLIIE